MDFAVAQIVADGDQGAAGHGAKQLGTANCDAKEGETRGTANGDDNLQLTDSTMEKERN